MSGSVAKGNWPTGCKRLGDTLRLRPLQIIGGAGGCIPVDDEGVVAGETVIIKDGLLNSYLHNRESGYYGVAPTGNARAWEYADQPLIRMRNTFIRPGNQSLEDIIASTEDGYLLDGPATVRPTPPARSCLASNEPIESKRKNWSPAPGRHPLWQGL